MDNILATPANPGAATTDPNSLTPLEQLNATLTRQEELRREELEVEKQKTAALLEQNEIERLNVEQRRRANELAQKQIDLMDEILADLTNLVIYRKSGVLEREIQDLKTLVNRLHYTIEAQILARPIDDKTKLLLKIIRGEADDEVELLLKTIQGDSVNPPRKRGVTGALRARSDSALGKAIDEVALVEALLQCSVIQRDFDTIKADMPLEVANRVTGNNRKVQVAELVRAAMQFGELRLLIETVRNYESDSYAMRGVDSLIKNQN